MKGYERGNIKVSYFDDPVFYINEPKRTVTCKLSARTFVPEENYFSGEAVVSMRPFTISEIATAKCHKNDTFDVERGKKIALAKAKSAVYLSAVHGVQKQIEQMNYLINAAEKFVDKGYRCIAVNEDYVDKLSMPGHPEYIKVIDKPVVCAKVASHIKK